MDRRRGPRCRLTIDSPQRPLAGDEWRSPYGDFFATWLHGVAWLVPGRQPLVRSVNMTEHETLNRSVFQRWQDAGMNYRPRNPNLLAWLRRELDAQQQSVG